MLPRQSLKTRADVVELVDFAQNCFENHGCTAFSPVTLSWEDFRWTGLGQKT